MDALSCSVASSLSLNDSREIEDKIKCLERELGCEDQHMSSNSISETTSFGSFSEKQPNAAEVATGVRIKGTDWLKEINENQIDGDQTLGANQTTMNESMFNNTTSNLFLSESDMKRKRVKYVK